MLRWLWGKLSNLTYFLIGGLLTDLMSDLLSRKLQPVYDCLDDRNWKGAIRLCQKKDVQGYDITKALHAYALVSMQKTEEGLEIAREVKDRNPTDEQVLKLLAFSFRNAQRDAEVAECYEAALQQYPHSEHMAIELFRAHARCGDAKKMQADALKLYKTHNNPKYVFWAVCCMMQQEQVSGTVYVLAERMLRRVLFETHALQPPKRTAGAEEALLWVEVLRKQAEHANTPADRITRLHEALQSLKDFGALSEEVKERSPVLPMHNPVDLDYRIDSDVQFKSDPSIVELHPLMSKLKQIEIVKLILSSCFADGVEKILGDETAKHGTRTGYASQLEVLFQSILFSYPDQWDVHQQWIAHVIDGATTSDGVLAHRDRLLKMQETHPNLRGPYLAEMHLFTEAFASSKDLCIDWAPTAVSAGTERLSNLPPAAAFHSEISRMICRYIYHFQHKDCCFADIKRYLDKTFRETVSGDAVVCKDAVVSWLLQLRAETNTLAWSNIAADPTAAPATHRDVFCRLNKLDQILHFMSVENTPRSLLVDRLALHASASSSDVTLPSSSAAKAGGEGTLEDRGLRAADNLLLICSAWIQDELAKRKQTGTSVPPEVRLHFFVKYRDSIAYYLIIIIRLFYFLGARVFR